MLAAELTDEREYSHVAIAPLARRRSLLPWPLTPLSPLLQPLRARLIGLTGSPRAMRLLPLHAGSASWTSVVRQLSTLTATQSLPGGLSFLLPARTHFDIMRRRTSNDAMHCKPCWDADKVMIQRLEGRISLMYCQQ